MSCCQQQQYSVASNWQPGPAGLSYQCRQLSNDISESALYSMSGYLADVAGSFSVSYVISQPAPANK